MALEVVGSDHTVGVVEVRHPIFGPRSRSFGQCLRDRREAAASMIEDAVEQQPHTPLPACRGQGVEVGVITQAWIDLEVVDRVVAVAAGGEDRAEQQAVAARKSDDRATPSALAAGSPRPEMGPALSRLRGSRGGRPATRSHGQPDTSRPPASGTAPHQLPTHTLSGEYQQTIAKLHVAVSASAVIHTDDIAWHHSRFGWSELLARSVRSQSTTVNPLTIARRDESRTDGRAPSRFRRCPTFDHRRRRRWATLARTPARRTRVGAVGLCGG